MPKVSIGMPVYNGERFIRKALDSLLAQNFHDYELIISDNYSTDNTQKICASYLSKDSRIRYIRQESNIGSFNNFQFVLDQSVGEYFMWAAHDDWWAPEFVEELHGLLERESKAVVAFCRIQHFHPDGVIFNQYPKLQYIGQNSVCNDRSKTSFEKFVIQNLVEGKVNIIYGLFRREILNKANVLKKWGDFGWGADLLIVAQVLRYGDVVFSPNFLWRKCLNPTSEGSLPKKEVEANLVEGVKGIFKTFYCYNKYVVGIWLVQKPIKDAIPIGLMSRLYCTLYEALRSNYAFIIQLSHAIKNRVLG